MKWSKLMLSVAFLCFGISSAEADESKLVAKGRLHSVVDNVALLATPIKGSATTQLKRAGFRKVTKEKDIAPGTIYKKSLYMGYTTMLDAKSLKRLKAKIGRKVKLILRRTNREKPVMVQVR